MSLAERFDAKWCPEPMTGCSLWMAGTTTAGYGVFAVRRRSQMAHRVAWVMAHGPIPDGLHVCHRCDTPACVNPAHLFLGTRFDNMRDCVAKGRHGLQSRPERAARGPRNGRATHPEATARGERNGNARLTDAQVAAIRAALARPRAERYGLRTRLARAYGISTTHVQRITRGESRSP